MPASMLDTPMDYDNLIAIGSMMGSGGMIVMDEDNCMVDIARFFLDFTVDESCGKCTPCRIGTRRMLEILNRIVERQGRGRRHREAGSAAPPTSRPPPCAAWARPRPTPYCPPSSISATSTRRTSTRSAAPPASARSCFSYVIDPAKCKGCTLCARVCPAGAISGAVQAAPLHRS